MSPSGGCAVPHCAAAAHVAVLLVMSLLGSCESCCTVLLLPVSPWRCSSCRHWAVASCAAVCCCPHCCHCHRCAACHVAVGQLQVVQWCAAACTTTATMMLVVSPLCGCHHHGGCHWVVPAHTI